MANPTDPLLAAQWHLSDINLSTTPPGTVSVWDDYSGAGVNVGVYDNGVQASHFDLDDNYNAALELTFNGVVQNGQIVGDHGTSVAGVIAAEANGLSTVGVAYDANLTSVPIWNSSGAHPWSNAYFQAAIEHQVNFDVVNHSWGFSGFSIQPDGSWYQVIREGLDFTAANGRGGLGTVVVAASSNQRHGEGWDGVRADANVVGPVVGDRHTITVGGYGQDGLVAQYSTPGSNILVSAPTDALWSGAGAGIVTTDRTDNGDGVYSAGVDGYTNNDTLDAVGTSFAAPIVTGVVALMLEANPNLGWRDVREILAASAQQVGSTTGAAQGNEFHTWFANGARDWNGGGHMFSEDYGFGAVDARAAVRLAETWTEQNTSANELSRHAGFVGTGTTLPDNNANGLVYNFNVSEGVITETIEIAIGMTHSWAADLTIELTSPSGTTTTLLNRVGGSGDVRALNLVSNAFLGEDATGTWSLRIMDLAAADVGTVTSAHLNVFGAQDSADQTFIFTDQYRELSEINVWRSYLDGNSGRDLLNAAAVSGDVLIDLRGTATGAGGMSQIDGAFLRILGGVEDAVTGDGWDILIGSEDANWLRGMRGDDQLNGNGGADSLEGGKGADRLYGDAGNDTVEGGAGLDAIAGGGDNDLLNGGFKNFMDSRGSDGDDVVTAGDGNDTVIASLEDDAVDGGDGVDLLTFIWTSQGVTADLDLGTADFAAGGSWTNPGGGGGGAWARLNTTTFSAIENLTGGLGADTLSGDANANRLAGAAGHDLLEGRGGADRLLGAGGADRLDGGTNDDVLVGDAGRDRLTGGLGRDMLTGGGDADTFDFNLVTESLSNLRDRILDFSTAEGDRIDLRSIDANEALSGNQAFAFIGAAGFSAAGQVRAVQSGGNTLVHVNTDADAAAEMTVFVTGLAGLAATEFLL